MPIQITFTAQTGTVSVFRRKAKAFIVQRTRDLVSGRMFREVQAAPTMLPTTSSKGTNCLVKSFVVFAGSCAALGLLSGCAPVNSSGSVTQPQSAQSDPYAGMFQQALSETADPVVREILADHRITDAEWAEVKSRFERCALGAGFTGIEWDGDDGAYGALGGSGDGDAKLKQLDICEASAGYTWVSRIRNSIRTNPSNIDPMKMMADCLVRLEVVARDYSADDYALDAPNMTFPYLDKRTGEAGFWKCNSDPSTNG
jgi:hypothetical protein